MSTGPFKFRPLKTRPAVYFNDGEHTTWIQQGDKADPELIEAIKTARRAFLRKYKPMGARGRRRRPAA